MRGSGQEGFGQPGLRHPPSQHLQPGGSEPFCGGGPLGWAQNFIHSILSGPSSLHFSTLESWEREERQTICFKVLLPSCIECPWASHTVDWSETQGWRLGWRGRSPWHCTEASLPGHSHLSLGPTGIHRGHMHGIPIHCVSQVASPFPLLLPLSLMPEVLQWSASFWDLHNLLHTQLWEWTDPEFELSYPCSNSSVVPRGLLHERKITSSAWHSESSKSFPILSFETSVHLQLWWLLRSSQWFLTSCLYWDFLYGKKDPQEAS